ncbi:MAG: hypothetical protein UR93_C0003G0009 [Berkelbacteria bacterium GW2011_GWA2_35_9]|uniref:Uncharacterized protein n=1 Tax=Berkelbacteria bacterium GW2011_GWA2_35_9 TaxID=1618333 RepID=A0A0G0GBH3_9BACT|nr:MAG: hypothetical protein UR93_C0003G0009 [Berkelbacteria bacterium GW2011_GWA2_35_9]
MNKFRYTYYSSISVLIIAVVGLTVFASRQSQTSKADEFSITTTSPDLQSIYSETVEDNQ